MNLETLPEIQAQTVKPYQRIIKRCPKCGRTRTRLPRWIVRLLDLPRTGFDLAYCTGGKAPERELSGPLGMNFTVENMCAGISADHLHVKCFCCEYRFLMATENPR